MPEQISPAAAQKIQALCAKVAVAHGLDEEIRHELCGHMEDELQACVTGRRALSEEDALILVEKHFGDPAVVRDLFRDVHGAESDVSVLRRLLSVAVVSGVLGAAFTIAWYVSPGFARARGVLMVLGLFIVPGALTVTCLWGIGAIWTRGVKRGGAPWFDRLPIVLLAGLLVAVFVLQHLLMWSITGRSLPVISLDQISSVPWMVWQALEWWDHLLVPVAMVAVWAWWCDWPSFNTRRAAIGAAGYAGWSALKIVGYTSIFWLHVGSRMGAMGAQNPRVMQMLRRSAMIGGTELLVAVAVGLGLYWLAARLAQRTRPVRAA